MDTPSDASPADPAESRDVVVRDDSADLTTLFDLIRERRGAGGRVKLVDSGKLATADLERLGEAGLEIYSSDTTRSDAHAFILMGLAARKGKSAASVFIHEPFHSADDAAALSFDAVLDLGRSGIRIAVSNGRVPRDPGALDRLAYACRKGGSRLVYYHAGPIDAALVELCRTGVWLHLDAAGLDPTDAPLQRECARAALAADGGLVLHVFETIDPIGLADLSGSGAFILFHTPPFDYRDPRRELEDRAKRHPLPPAAFYLFPKFIL